MILMIADLLSRARAIAGDRDAGASELVARLLPLLDEAIRAGRDTTVHLARIVCGGQPAMAPLWHACAAALADADQPGTFARVRAEMERAPRALVRAAADALSDLLRDEASPAILTLSYSGSVAAALREVQKRQALRLICAESRPRLEGRRLAAELAAAGMAVTVVIDAALTTYLSGASAIVVGADAVLPEHWINKSGSFGLCAAASFTGTPVYVVASRDKFVPRSIAPRLVTPPGADFERTPIELATLLLTDVGPIPPSSTAEVPAYALYDYLRLI
jgi:translation initiation factor 2B subunit (eIF-2B alpha/beta/delta family)